MTGARDGRPSQGHRPAECANFSVFGSLADLSQTAFRQRTIIPTIPKIGRGSASSGDVALGYTIHVIHSHDNAIGLKLDDISLANEAYLSRHQP
jgi:hypothetical protein